MGRVYYQIIDITDLGPNVTKLVLGMPRKVTRDEIFADQFNVYVEILDKSGNVVMIPENFLKRDKFIPSTAYREVTRAYPSCLNGNEMDEGEYVTLEMPYGPMYEQACAHIVDWSDINGHESYAVCNYRITQTREIGKDNSSLKGLLFNQCAGVFNPKKERFRINKFSDEKLSMRYGYYMPDNRAGKMPLIVFLHGAGEGGFDTPIAWTGIKVTELTEEWMQEKFGGAVVLVPQCETMWLDDGSHQYGNSGVSMYTESLKGLIDEFVEKNADRIDRDRIYIGGDSNGGFMTMRMIMSYPSCFAAAFPICEAMPDQRITDQDIDNLKMMPIWFTHSKDDNIVPPNNYVVPTYERLMKAGARNVHFTFWDEIKDIHSGFQDASGKPYKYEGHFAWIPVLNDDCRLDYDGKPVVVDGREVRLWDWLAGCKR